jgi:HAD superfamily hydrolase (TIGR01509 family)
VIKAVIFDCFGVVISDALSVMTAELYKSHPEAEAQVHEWLRQTNTGKLTAAASAERVSMIFGLSYQDYRQQLLANEIKNQALLDYIVSLRPKYKIGMLSNVSIGGLKRRFSSEDIAKYFDACIASGEIGYAKPEARAYEITAERLGVRLDECVLTDDRQPYCDGAKAVGMQAILYQDFDRFKNDLEALLADA